MELLVLLGIVPLFKSRIEPANPCDEANGGLVESSLVL